MRRHPTMHKVRVHTQSRRVQHGILKPQKMMVIDQPEYAGSIVPSYSVSSGEGDQRWEGGVDVETMLPMYCAFPRIGGMYGKRCACNMSVPPLTELWPGVELSGVRGAGDRKSVV